MPSVVALIPARGGSKRIPRKNIRPLAGHPLIAYTIAAARAAGIFTDVIVSSEDAEIRTIAARYGASVTTRPARYAADESPDIDWVLHVMAERHEDAFAILRPTSPFRTARTIRRAWDRFQWCAGDSMRAVQPWAGPHPGKMWTYDNVTVSLSPVLHAWTARAPYHSSPTQALVPVLVQNASLEMAWRKVLTDQPPTIAGNDVVPFFTDGHEGFDLNTEADWIEAERLIQAGKAVLPMIEEAYV